MRKLVVALAVVLLALSALALAPGVVPTPYADILPKVIAGVAVLLLIAIFADRSKVESAGPAKKSTAPIAAPLVNQADSEVVNFLAILQERGRFVGFLMDDITACSDAQVGAAGRVLHEGCKAVLLEHFGIRPMREEDEGTKITIPTGYAPDDYRFVGKRKRGTVEMV
jgi:Domain of unknown function (DUF2760)